MKTLSPGSVVVLASLFLSLVAVVGDPVVNRDGILYIQTAETLINQGLAEARGLFDWPFFPILVAGLAWLTPLDPEVVAYLLCALFLAGACFFLVRISDRLMPGTAWAAVVVVLCLPALNEYRSFVIREFGAWFFVFGAVYALLGWCKTRSWRRGGLFQAGVALAVLFRPEMVFVLAGVVLAWPWLRRPGHDGRDAATLFWGCAAVAVVGIGFVLQDLSVVGGRMERFVGYLDLSRQLNDFSELSDHFGREVLNRFSRESADFILFWGLVAMIPATAMELLGILVFPLGYAFRPGVVSQRRLASLQPFPALVLVYLGILVLFLIVKQRLPDRYVIPLVLLLVPLVVEGFRALSARIESRGWRYLFAVLLVITAAAGVITTGDRKLYIKSAGEWIREQDLPKPVFFDEPQQRYYAGFAYKDNKDTPSRSRVLEENGGRYRSLVLVVDNADQASRLQRFTQRNAFRKLASFGEPHQGVWILVRD